MLHLLLFLYLFTWSTQAQHLNVHIIAHSHCDPGWLNTFEGYFGQDVNTILDGVTKALKTDKNRKFVWSEISFFSRWYEAQPASVRNDFQSLIQSGQIEFVGGGWVQNDEANPDYIAIINQISAGHDYLLKNFNVVPKIAWQIDPFGHSAVMPSVLALMGYDALVINRIHHRLKGEFKNARHMEFLWRGMDVGSNADMFTHVLHTHYSAPSGFDWEDGVPRVYSGNLAERSQTFAQIMRQRASSYRSNHLLVPFGDDFKFKNAQLQFENMGQIIEYINSHSEFQMTLSYSTLSDYFKAVHDESVEKTIEFPLFQGDFFPYADNEDSYWTGYYTTRPLLKQSSRRLESDVRAAEMLHTLLRGAPDSDKDTNMQLLPTSYWESKYKEIEQARQDTALFLHHDAITGTSRSNVVDDYLSRMSHASDDLRAIIARMLEHAMTREPNPSPKLTHTPFVLEHSGDHVHPITLYNPLAWQRQQVVSIVVASRYVAIKNPAGEIVTAQIASHFATASAIEPDTSYVVSFVADIPPLGAITYFVHVFKDAADAGDLAKNTIIAKTIVLASSSNDKLRGAGQLRSSFVEYQEIKNVKIENDFLSAEFNTKGLLHSLRDIAAKTDIQISQKFAHYTTSRSGAYLFRPQYKNKMESTTLPYRYTKGYIQSSITTVQSKWDITFTLAHSTNIDLAGHIAYTQTVSADPNTEVVMELDTDMKPSNFYTSSGLGFLKRTRGTNPAANFYPMVQGARLVSGDENAPTSRLTILTAHSMACGTQDDGHMEFMMHRYLNQDDGRGLAQAVTDATVVDITFWISLDATRGEVDFRRRSLMLNQPVLTFYQLASTSDTHQTASREDLRKLQWTMFKPLKAPLPDHIHMLSLTTKDSITDEVAVRFQSLSSDAATGWGKDLDDVFTHIYSITDLRATTLSLNQQFPIGGTPSTPRWKWPYASSSDQKTWTTLQPVIQTDNQNSEEEGVFISNAALEQKKRDLEAAARAAAAAGAGRRRLLDITRHLMSAASTLITVHPLQIQSFIFRMSGNNVARQDTREEPIVDVDPGHIHNGEPQQTQPQQPKQSQEPQDPQQVDPHGHDTSKVDPLWRAMRGAALDHHTHTVMPGQGRHILPNRYEYIIILILMITLVLFYLSLLQFNACRQIKRRTMYVMED